VGGPSQSFSLVPELSSSIVQDSSGYELLAKTSTPGLLEFIRKAYEQSPSLFSDHVSRQDTLMLYADVHTVFSTWRRLKWMRASKEKWSEHDFVANVSVNTESLLSVAH
jgi:hypothetical protein